jgi:glycosyltransferase involved in cell wall biosynthesis
MRVVHVSDCYLPRLGGIECQVHDLALRQQQHGHTVEIVTSVAGTSTRGPEDLPVRRPAARPRGPVRMRYGWSAQGRDVVLGGGFDVVHVHASTVSPLAFLVAASASRVGLATAVTVHSLWGNASPLFWAAEAGMGWSRWPLAWSAVSSIAADPLRRIIGPRAPVTVLPNGVDVPWWRSAPNPRDPSRVVVASVGRLAARKRPHHLLRILRRARARLPREIRLEAVIVGDGPLRRLLEHYLRRHDMGGWVRLLGAVDHDQIRALYRDVDLYVAPATLESFGIAALEARCAGLPVVAHAASGIADFIGHDVEGLLVGDDDGMVDAIVGLARSRSTLDRLRHHNRDHPPAITWPGVLEAADSLYQRARHIAGYRYATGSSAVLLR